VGERSVKTPIAKRTLPHDEPAFGYRTATLFPERLELEPERIEQGLARLVLAVVELVREVLERQAVRRVEAGGLSEEEVERLGVALMRLNERLAAIREVFGLTEEDVTLRFGGEHGSRLGDG
jgi:hypothetical protein